MAEVGDRFAALQLVDDAVIDRFGALGADVAQGIPLRYDWGPQHRSAHFLGSIAGRIADDAAFRQETREDDAVLIVVGLHVLIPTSVNANPGNLA
jgi:hypothetical protein